MPVIKHPFKEPFGLDFSSPANNKGGYHLVYIQEAEPSERQSDLAKIIQRLTTAHGLHREAKAWLSPRGIQVEMGHCIWAANQQDWVGDEDLKTSPLLLRGLLGGS